MRQIEFLRPTGVSGDLGLDALAPDLQARGEAEDILEGPGLYEGQLRHVVGIRDDREP
jgi:hypothetical protein